MYPEPRTGEMRRIEHWNVSLTAAALLLYECHARLQVAGNQGRAVGKTIAQGKGQPFVKVPVFWSARKYAPPSFWRLGPDRLCRGPTAAVLWSGRWL